MSTETTALTQKNHIKNLAISESDKKDEMEKIQMKKLNDEFKKLDSIKKFRRGGDVLSRIVRAITIIFLISMFSRGLEYAEKEKKKQIYQIDPKSGWLLAKQTVENFNFGTANRILSV